MSTQRRRHIIQCSPHISSEFVTGSGDLRLYEITTKHGIPNPNNLSFTTESVDEFRTKQNRSLRDDAKSFRLLSVNADIQNVRCVTWNPDVVQPRLVAAGLGSGRIALTNFSYSGFGISKEFIPRHGRLCNALDWNTTHKNHLASAHDKVRLDHSCLIWDVETQGQGRTTTEGEEAAAVQGSNSLRMNIYSSAALPSAQTERFGGSTSGPQTVTKPLLELPTAEANLSLSWFPSQPSCLATGTAIKYVRVYDIRDNGIVPTSFVAHSRGVYGLSFDPFNDNMLATYSEDSVVKVWDLRRFPDPVLSFSTGNKSLMQIAWCPTRSGVLASVSKDEKYIKLWHIKEGPYVQEEKGAGSLKVRENLLSPENDLASSKSEGEVVEEMSPLSSPTVSVISPLPPPPPVTDKVPRSQSKSDSEETRERTYILNKAYTRHDVGDVLSSISWHPTDEYCLLSVSYSGTVEAIPLRDAIPLAVSGQSSIVFGFGTQLVHGSVNMSMDLGRPLESTTDSGFVFLREDSGDISVLMKKRAELGYGVDIDKNNKVIQENSHIFTKQMYRAWRWMEKLKKKISTNENNPITVGTGLQRILEGVVETKSQFCPAVEIKSSSSSQKYPAAVVKEEEEDYGERHYSRDDLLDDMGLGDSERDPWGDWRDWGTDMAAERADIKTEVFPSKLSDEKSSKSMKMAKQKDIEPEQHSGPLGIYTNPRRSLALQLCGWPTHWQKSNFLNWLAGRGQVERAAAIGVFHGQLFQAIKILNDEAARMSRDWGKTKPTTHALNKANNLRLASMAIAGYSSKDSMWRAMCQQMLEGMDHPYLRCCFSFLSCDVNTAKLAFKTVLASEIHFSDKIAFACRFLSDEELTDYIERTTAYCVQNGILEGLQLTGITKVATELLQNYVNKTADVQTASSIMSNVLPIAYDNDARPERWAKFYRDLLDGWKLWKERAVYDIQRSRVAGKNVNANAVESQVYVRCCYCQQSLALGMIQTRKVTNELHKITSCPICKKALPRCCICLLPFNCSVPTLVHGEMQLDIPNQIDNWFSWCQACRHGGHAKHLLAWFSNHSECPITKCNCRCKI